MMPNKAVNRTPSAPVTFDVGNGSMRHLIMISIVLIGTGLGSLGSSFSNLYRDAFIANQTVTTDDGAMIHELKSGSQYGPPVEGKYLVQIPRGIYVKVSNVKGWWLIGCIPMVIGLVTLVVAYNVMRKRISSNLHERLRTSNRDSQQVDSEGTPLRGAPDL
jgi:hypothetical protein